MGVDDNLLSSEEVSFSLNPTTGKVLMTGSLCGQQDIEVFNAQGQFLSTHQLVVGTELDLNTLPAGCYLIRVSNDENYRTQRLIKQ